MMITYIPMAFNSLAVAVNALESYHYQTLSVMLWHDMLPHSCHVKGDCQSLVTREQI
jgi:hypothetical protein